jgi:hypothetical protein
MFPYNKGTVVIFKSGNYRECTFVKSWNNEKVQLSNGMEVAHSAVSVYEISAWHIAEYLLARDGVTYYTKWLKTPAADQVHTLIKCLDDRYFVREVKDAFGGKAFNTKDIRAVAVKVIAHLQEASKGANHSKH